MYSIMNIHFILSHLIPSFFLSSIVLFSLTLFPFSLVPRWVMGTQRAAPSSWPASWALWCFAATSATRLSSWSACCRSHREFTSCPSSRQPTCSTWVRLRHSCAPSWLMDILTSKKKLMQADCSSGHVLFVQFFALRPGIGKILDYQYQFIFFLKIMKKSFDIDTMVKKVILNRNIRFSYS